MLGPALAGLALTFAATPGQAQICATSDTNTSNTACGSGAGNNDSGTVNSAFGEYALASDTTGGNNTAAGFQALFGNTTGNNNTAVGVAAISGKTTGSNNSGFGADALFNSTSGDNNTASGFAALEMNTTASNNTATGYEALYKNTTGADNVAVGYEAGYGNTSGVANTFVGTLARPNAGGWKNGTAIGYDAVLTASNSIVLGDDQITAIHANVQSISALSDRRRKKDIAPLGSDLGLSFIEKLQPVSYRFKNGDETERYGFIAQDLEQALPAKLQNTVENAKPEHGLALVERENDADRTYRVAYGELTAPLVKAVQELKAENDILKKEMAAQSAENAALRETMASIRKRLGMGNLAKN